MPRRGGQALFLRQRPGQWGTGCAFADLDGDGWLDLYVANYVRYLETQPLLGSCVTVRRRFLSTANILPAN